MTFPLDHKWNYISDEPREEKVKNEWAMNSFYIFIYAAPSYFSNQLAV